MRTALCRSTLSVLVLLLSVRLVLAQTGSGGNVPYVSGGVGSEEKNAMEGMKDYNLKLTMAQTNGHFVGDVKVRIQDPTGQTVLDVIGGPLILVQLKPGTYKVSATNNGQERTQSVTIGSGSRKEASFTWPPVGESPEPPPEVVH